MAASGGEKKREKPKKETKEESKEESVKELLIAVSKGDPLAYARLRNKMFNIYEEDQALFKPLAELKDSSDSSVILKGVVCYGVCYGLRDPGIQEIYLGFLCRVTNDPKISNEIKSTIIYHTALAFSFPDGKKLPGNIKRDFQVLVNTQPKLFFELMNADYLKEKSAPIEESAIGKRVKKLLGAELSKKMMEDRERYLKVIAQKRHALLVRGLPDVVANIVLSGVFKPHVLSAVDPVSKKLEDKVSVRQKNEKINNIINRLLSGEEKLTEKTTATLNAFVKEMQAKKEDSIAADEWSRLGLISFLNGEPVESLECLNNALKKGATDARVYYYLSKLYSDGKAVKSDSGKEKQYFTEAVKRGHPEANFIFGKECDRCYRDKKEPTYSRMRDFKEARQCFEKAKNEGHAEAAYYLARLHESNLPEIGVSADLRSAKECYTFAAERGFEKAKTALKKFEAPATARSRR